MSNATVTPKNSYTKKEIRLAYNWSDKTFARRLKEIPGLNEMIGDKRILSIHEAEMIFFAYGRPRGY